MITMPGVLKFSINTAKCGSVGEVALFCVWCLVVWLMYLGEKKQVNGCSHNNSSDERPHAQLCTIPDTLWTLKCILRKWILITDLFNILPS